MPTKQNTGKRASAARLRAVVDELHDLAAEVDIPLDEQLRIEAAARAAHAGSAPGRPAKAGRGSP